MLPISNMAMGAKNMTIDAIKGESVLSPYHSHISY